MHDDNKLHGDGASDSYLENRQHYTKLAKELGSTLGQMMVKEDLVDLRTKLLVMLIRHKEEGGPAHIYALLIQLMTEIQDNIRKKEDTELGIPLDWELPKR